MLHARRSYRRIVSVSCAALLLTASVGATTYARVEGRLTLASSGTATASSSPSASAATGSASPSGSPSTTTTTTTTTSTTTTSSMRVSDPLTGTAFSGVSQVGTLFGTSGGSLTSHHCTGSVVASLEGDIVVTAAHCVYSNSGAETDL